ncbi:MAG: hypothetical protein LQ351_002385 [Letrouitia transgressa]|nr:MAG: hypothetical protein LQ351_002385 [Letrouitia transgressa]
MPPPSNLDPNTPETTPPEEKEEQPRMHASTSSTSTSSLVRGRPKTVYFHGGIGGAGNYRKVVRTDDESLGPHPRTEPRRSPLPRAINSFFRSNNSGRANVTSNPKRPALTTEEELAQSKVGDRHSPSRGFFGIGGKGNRRARRQQSPSSDTTNADSGYASQHSGQAVDLGAAEFMRRKMLGDRSAGSTRR